MKRIDYFNRTQISFEAHSQRASSSVFLTFSERHLLTKKQKLRKPKKRED